MVILLNAPPKKRNSLNQLMGGVAAGAGSIGSMLNEKEKRKMQEEQLVAENEFAARELNLDLSGVKDPKMRQEILASELTGRRQQAKSEYEAFTQGQQDRAKHEHEREMLNERENLISKRPKKEERPTKTPFGEKEVPHEISRKIKKIIIDTPNANADELKLEMDEQGIPPSNSNPYIENRRRTEEQVAKSQESKQSSLRSETLPIRKQIADKAMAASHGIQNKEQLIDLIEKGDINDPTFAALAEALPLNLGKRMLSNDTVEYKAGLVEEFGDLRNIFQGQTRIKEIELLENKIADLYLTDEQKKSVLKSRINALKGDVIRAEVAQEIENEPYGVLQFSQEVEKRAKPKLEALFNQILDEQKSIIQNAENKKKTGLDINDPDDKQILMQIFKEAGNDKVKARKLAEKKGYKF